MRVLLPSIWFTAMMFAPTNAQQWSSIVPLHSTRSDVESLLGPAEGKELSVYQLENEVVSVQFSQLSCDEKRHQGWNVPRDTVVMVTVSSRTAISFSDLPIDQTVLKKKQDSHLPDITYYVNEDQGVTYHVSVIGTVTYTSYGPKAKDEHLRCPRPMDQQQSTPDSGNFNETVQ